MRTGGKTTMKFDRIAGILVALAFGLTGCGGRPEHPMTTIHPTSDFGVWINRLYLQVTLWDVLIFTVVIVSFTLAVFVFSTRAGEAAPPSTAASDIRLEIVYTIGPALVILMISIPTVRTVFRSQPAVPPKNAVNIEVVGHQWWWEFNYLDGSKAATANELHIPVGRPIHLQLKAYDVIHSFWVPALGGKRDVIPGQVNEIYLIANEPGEYYGQCAEFCGESHANMRFRVFVDPPERFASWEQAQAALPAKIAPTDTALAEGAKIFANSPCTTCHAIRGVSKGYFGPDLTHFGSRETFASGVYPNTPENVARWITDPVDMKPGAMMPKFAVGSDQLAALTAYLESLK